MYTLIIILILITAVLLGLVILIQNPKGGGLNASLGGVSNQVFGAKKSTDIVEKTTWYLGLAIFVLCLISVTQINTGSSEDFNSQDSKIEQMLEEVDLPENE
ncbi:MAG: preprotein translocase subunit SecG [Planctomycetota bacterium]|jgi:preprotein translocase subunit SecG